jgi:diguanylate cyclase (GGDEF)-like protein/PAS domain S-box-containing protein
MDPSAMNLGSQQKHRDSILVINGAYLRRTHMAERLAQCGFSLIFARGTRRAYELIDREEVGLVLLSLQPSPGKRAALLQEIRRRSGSNSLPIIVLCQHPGKHLSEVFQWGASEVIETPVNIPLAILRIQAQIQRRQSEENLREIQERFALAVAGSKDGIWDWNLKTGKVYFSTRWASLLGYKTEDIGNDPETWFGRIHPLDVDRVKIEFDAHLSGQTPYWESEHRLLHSDGFYRWVFVRGLAAQEENERPTRVAGSLSDVTEYKMADALTGLPNRLLFMDRLGRSVERAKRYSSYLFAILFLDIDRFKVVNDSLGHAIGDQLLIALSARIQSCLRPGDTLARMGGDEFTLHLEEIKHFRDTTLVADRISESLKSPFQIKGQNIYASVSIGIALSVTGYDRPEDLLRDAEMAMFRAKASCQGSYEMFDTKMRARAQERLKLEADLRHAVERGEFENFYQPVVCLKTGRTKGFEALVRWNHPTQGLVYPAEFISLAEETGLIIPLGEWVLREACLQMSTWSQQFPECFPLNMSVNLSGRQILRIDLVEMVKRTLGDSGLSPDVLNLEITESVLMENTESSIMKLTRLREMGVNLSIDDFGTGYSSLSYLHRFPVGTLKIDRSFIHEIGPETKKLEFVHTIVSLAHHLNLTVVAEGVEEAMQADQLRLQGCEYGQGYYFSRPMSRQATMELLVQEANLSSEETTANE